MRPPGRFVWRLLARAAARWWRRDDAAVVVEFALVVPILLLIVFGIIDFSRAYYAKSTLSAAVRQGARFAALQPRPASPSVKDSIRVLVRGQLVGLTPALADSTVIDASFDSASATVRVWVSAYPFRPITPIPRLLGWSANPILTDTAAFRWERAP